LTPNNVGITTGLTEVQANILQEFKCQHVFLISLENSNWIYMNLK